jgi:hypothetical protein
MGKFEQAGGYWGGERLIHRGGMARLCWRAYVASAVRCRTVNESESVSYWSQTLALPGAFFSARFDQDSDMVWRAKASGNGKVYEEGVWERIVK